MTKKAGNLFTTAYLLLMFCVYPFYMENGYVNIGEAKNRFFLLVSMASFALLFAIFFLQLAGMIKEKKEAGLAYLIDWEKVSATDLLMLVYATAIFLSYAFSEYKKEALWGTEGWYMGCVPILLLCGLYFLISRMWMGERVVFYGILVASAVVCFLGICNRFSFYPISMTTTQPSFISTLGNINWFCGYLSVIAPLGLGGFVLWSNGLRKRIFLTAYAFIVFMAGFCQGSSSVFLWFAALFVFLLWVSLAKKSWMKNWALLLVIWGISAQLVRVLRYVFEGKYNYEVDNICGYFTDSSLSLWIALAGLVLWFVAGHKAGDTGEIRVAGKGRKWLTVTVLGTLGVWIVLSLVNTVWGIGLLREQALFVFNAEWGHGRGIAFYAGMRAFWEFSFLHKLTGAGPDCFAKCAYEISELALMLRESFGSARLTNAHNELLTALVNTGLLGVCAYVGIFISFIKRCCREGKEMGTMYIPALCIFCYLIHNMVSFAQVLNFPFVFLILGMSEALSRKRI